MNLRRMTSPCFLQKCDLLRGQLPKFSLLPNPGLRPQMLPLLDSCTHIQILSDKSTILQRAPAQVTAVSPVVALYNNDKSDGSQQASLIVPVAALTGTR
jgi:hypothetical protein